MPERIKRFRDFFGIPSKTDFSSWEGFSHSPIVTWFLVVSISVLVAFFAKYSFVGIPAILEEGGIASRDIKADRNYEIVDQEATDSLRDNAVTNILSVYDYNQGLVNALLEKVDKAFLQAKIILENYIPVVNGKNAQGELNESLLEELRKSLLENLGTSVTDADLKVLIRDRFSENTNERLKKILVAHLSRPIISDREEITKDDKGIALRFLAVDGKGEIEQEASIGKPEELTTVDDIRKKLSDLKISDQMMRSPLLKETLISLAQSLVLPNVTPNQLEWSSRQEQAKKGVQDVIIKVKAGEMIVRNGARFNASHIKILDGIRQERMRTTYPLEFLGTILFVVISIVVVYYFAERFIVRFHPARLDYVLMGLMVIFHVMIIRLGFSLAPVFHDALPIDVPVSALIFAMPMAGSAMLLRMLLHAEDTILFVITTTLVTSMFASVDLQFICFFIISNVAGIIFIANADKRSSIIRAGVLAGFVNTLTVLGIKFLGLASISFAVSTPEIVWYVVAAFAGGLASAVLVMIVVPLVESLLGYTTDIKLLELANLNHPILRELIVRAPGTYHHSHLVGIIAEAGAETVGANALLVRVAAYYHDIGKIKKPLYFVENARNGEDKHAKLSPHMSSLIISSHVKDGVDMAKEVKLPRAIINMITQHHGTRSIGFFYEKAKAMSDDENKLDPTEFEYEGPKPQSREAAILMLADVAEASVRALKEKGAARISQTVNNVIQTCFTEKQLDECDLTLRDLNDLSKAFTRILLGIYHQRIDYQVETDQRSSGNGLLKEKSGGTKTVQLSSSKEDEDDTFGNDVKKG